MVKKGLVVVDSEKKVVESIDWKRVVFVSFFGVGFVGFIGYLWYEGLEIFVMKGLKFRVNLVSFIVMKVVCDVFVFGFIYLLVFFLYMGLMLGVLWVMVKCDVEWDFIFMYMMEGLGWGVV